ncbi:MAG TPA: MBL fold metallo-hydrolase [Dehalococcoidales bacterium]
MDVIVDTQNLKIERLELSSFATNAYIVICPRTGKSALIDAPGGAMTLVKHLKGTQLDWILLTHSHIDHIGGLKATRDRLVACLAVNEADNQKWLPVKPDMALSDGDKLMVGKVKIDVIYTPGHTTGSMCFKIGKYLFAGDTLFPGGPGRTIGPSEFKQIVVSITEKLFKLPGDTQVYPGHGPSTTLKQSKEEYRVFASHDHDSNLCGDVLWLVS